jgi:hypothetical protein
MIREAFRRGFSEGAERVDSGGERFPQWLKPH